MKADTNDRYELARIRLSPQLPLLLRQERFLEPAPEGVAWKPKFDDALSLSAKACWLRACEAFIALAERVPNEPTIIRNIAILRGYLGDTSGATLWWRMSVIRTRCSADLKLSVPDRAWLTSSSVESRRASRVPVVSDPSLAAGISVSYISAR